MSGAYRHCKFLPAGAALLTLFGCQTAGSNPSGKFADELAGSKPIMPTGFLFKELVHEGTTFRYAMYVPRAYSPQTPMPAIVFLHGRGECGADGQKMIAQGIGTNILWNAARWPFIVLMPQKPDERLQWEDYDAVVMRMLETTIREFSIDVDRIALTGLSQGGHGVFTLGATHPDVWSALIPICGYARTFEPRDVASKIAALPMWCFHGAIDDVVPPGESQALIDAIRIAGGSPKLTIYAEANHNSWDRAYAEPDLPGWIVAQHRHRGN